jgi:1-deoxy-D-xylulose-5-phosphate reductoisomerase
MTTRISVLGSTGNIGESTIRVVRSLKGKVRIVGLAAGKNIDRILEQIKEFSPLAVSVRDEEDAKKVKKVFPRIEVFFGPQGSCEIAALPDAQTVVAGIVGIAGLPSTYRAIKLGKRIALANKEALVTAGSLMTKAAKKSGAELIPVDSEHCAIFQCLRGESIKQVSRILLTGSGGALRDYPLENITNATLDEVMKHPTWTMGRKITVDSATLMNKGLELIEASYLFGLPAEKIEVVIHRESVVHSLVEFVDGSVMAQLAAPDMALPIQYAITFPVRACGDVQRLDLASMKSLSFEKPETKRYPCFKLAKEAFATSEAHTIALNSANEAAVKAFIAGRINFGGIHSVIKKVLAKTIPYQPQSIEEVLHIDEKARTATEKIILKGE